MGRSPCCVKNGLKKGPWTSEEDRLLISYIQKHGPGNWRTLPKNAGLERCGKSCRLRWTNYLRPDIKRGGFSFEEEETIIQLHSMMGNKWSEIASRLPRRTDNEIKNYWNTHIKKKLLKMGIDPVTHEPKLDLLNLSSILYSVFCNQLSLLNVANFIGNQPNAVTLELLRLSSILSRSKQHDPSSLLPRYFQENHQLLMNSDQQQQPENGYYQMPLRDEYSPEMNQQVIRENSEVLSSSTSSQSLNYYSYPNSYQNLVPSELSELYTSGHSDHMTSQLPENLNLQSLNHINQNSTPLTSSSTYINSNEDEKESYCSSLFDFEIPEGLDMADFL